jgi:hypothetical protein
MKGVSTMALNDSINTLRKLLAEITSDLEKAANGNKAASQRVRTGTVQLEKIAKLYRKESVKSEKSSVGKKKVKKAVAKKAAPKKAAPKKAAPKKAAARKTTSGVKSFSVKRRATAKLPARRSVSIR